MFCKNCGKELTSESGAFCVHCGTAVEQQPAAQEAAPQQVATPQPVAPQYAPQPIQPVAKQSGLATAAKVFMIIGTILSAGGYLIPLCWTIPMTVSYCRKLKNNQPIGTGFKVCCLLFVSLLGGIFMLCDNNKK